MRAGRGWGKTRTGAEFVINRARHGPYYPIALVAETKADARDVMVEIGESSILRRSPPDFMPHYEPSKRRVTWPNGMIAIIYSGDEPGQLRGPQHGTAWVDELVKYKYPQEVLDNVEMGLRLGHDPRGVITTTPKAIKTIKNLMGDPDVVEICGNRTTYANVGNLSPVFVRRMLQRYQGTRLGRQELDAEILDDNPNALWNRDRDIETHRVNQAPRLFRVGVGVDPPASAAGAECGIIVAGVGMVSGVVHGFVLADKSMRGLPAAWGGQSVAAYSALDCDILVGEINNGGDMVGHTISTVDGGDTVNFKAVRASRGKYTRAEPISALYQQGRVHHVGTFGQLEDQLCEWEPGQDSPDRLDALVWILTELMIPQGKRRKQARALR